MANQLKLQQLLKLLDLTRLTDNDNQADMAQWLQNHLLPTQLPAAFCVYPAFLPQCAEKLQQLSVQSRLATVVNFPSGNSAADVVVQEIQAALALGADEIDCVLPYQALLAGDTGRVKVLYEIRQASGTACLKVIIESGALSTPQQIIKATELVIECGADFVKSSTGKVPVGITMEAARIMLTVIAAANRPVGFKASGGVRTVAQALELMAMYEEMTGRLAQPELMRIGASVVFAELVSMLTAGS